MERFLAVVACVIGLPAVALGVVPFCMTGIGWYAGILTGHWRKAANKISPKQNYDITKKG
jgi:hypothetical protein